MLQNFDALKSYTDIVDRYVITSSTDLNGTITSVSQAFCDISGYSQEELIGHNHNIVRHPDMSADIYRELWETITTGKAWTGEIKNRKKNGDFYWVLVHIEPKWNELKQIIGYVAVRQDITDKKRIETLMMTDELTGTYNRRFFNQRFPLELRRAKRAHQWLCFLMVDADNFKKYNDTYGHQAGDDVLKEIAQTLLFTFSRAEDFVFRLGGEEFAVLYSINEPEDGYMLAERARAHISSKNIDHSGNLPFHRVTLSMGLMILDPDKQYVSEEIYKYADEALYRAKANGRNQVSIVDSLNDDIELFWYYDAYQ